MCRALKSKMWRGLAAKVKCMYGTCESTVILLNIARDDELLKYSTCSWFGVIC